MNGPKSISEHSKKETANDRLNGGAIFWPFNALVRASPAIFLTVATMLSESFGKCGEIQVETLIYHWNCGEIFSSIANF